MIALPNYVRVGGPPADWDTYRVRNLTTGELENNCTEVNVSEGWIRKYTGAVDTKRMEYVQKRFKGRFEIERIPDEELK